MPSATTHEHVQRMLDQIHENCGQRLTLATLARHLERQSAYLGKLFRDEIGVSVHEYITRARMMLGAAQIRSGVKIEAVALDLGYRSKKNFYRQFKRRFGMTPEMYRCQHGNTAGNGWIVPTAVGDFDDHRRLPANAALPLGSLEQEVLVRTITDAPVALLTTDENGCYVAANQGAVVMTGYSADELRGMPVAALLPARVDSETKRRLQLILPASSSLPCNAVLRTKSERPVAVHLTSAENLLQDGGG